MNILTIRRQLNAQPGTISTFTDFQVEELFRDLPTEEAPKRHVLAELWLRRWLYAGEFSISIKQAIESGAAKGLAGFSESFSDRFRTELFPLRLNDDGRFLPDAGSLDEEENRIWGLLTARVQSFLEADGLIALIPAGAKDHDGVAVPFRFVSGKAGSCFDIKGTVLSEWSEVLNELDNLGPSAGGQALRIEAVFPAQAPPSGASLGLPIALAWHRRQAQDFPLFSPLAMLATGELRGNKVFAVRGTGGTKADTQGGAKGQLAYRLGVKLYLAVDVAAEFATGTGVTVRSFTSGTQWNQVQSLSSETVKALNLAHDPRHLQRVEQEESRPASDEDLPAIELWSRWRRLGKVRDAFPKTDPRCTKAATGQRRIEVDLGFHDVGVIAAASNQVVSDYRRRRFVGRNGENARLNDFLTLSQGGMMAVLGSPGYGKSALMAQLVDRLPSNRATLVHFFRQDRQRTRSVAGFIRRLWHFLLSEIGTSEGLPGQMSPEELVSRVDVAWQDWAALPMRRPLVIVIDGLDEAEDAFELPWPSGLPDKVHVIVACRTGTNFEPPSKWRPWLLGATKIPLGGLKVEELVDWLGDLSESERAKLPELYKLAVVIEQRTLGCALFAQYLLDDLRRGIAEGQGWELVLSRTPTGFADYLYQQYLEFNGPGTSRARQLIALLVAAYEPLYLGEIQRILPGLEPGYAFTDLPWQAYRWVTRETGREEWGEQFSLTHDVLREALSKIVVQTNAKEHLLAFCQDYKIHLSPYAVRNVAKYNVDCFSPQDKVVPGAGIAHIIKLPSSSTAHLATPIKEVETLPEQSVSPVPSKCQTNYSQAINVVGEDSFSPKVSLPDPIPELAISAKRPVVSLSDLEVLNQDPVFLEASSIEAPEEPAPVLNAVRRALEQIIHNPRTDYRKITELALTHAKLLHQLAQQDESSIEDNRSTLATAEHYLKLPVQWDPAAQVMWRLVAAWEHHRANRTAERARHIKALCNTNDVRLPAAWGFLAGALLAEVFPPYHPMLYKLSERLLGVEAMAEMVGRLIAQGDAGVSIARQWLKRGSSYEISVLRRHVVYSLAKAGRWREAEWEAREASTIKEQANLILRLAELAENDLNRTRDLWKWVDYLKAYVEYATLPTGDYLRVNSVLGRITAILVKHDLLCGRNNVRELTFEAEAYVQGKGFSRGSGKFDVQVALSIAYATAAVRRKGRQNEFSLRTSARLHRRKAFRAWLQLREASGDTLEVFQIWLWFAHLTFGIVRAGVLPDRIGKLWEDRLRRVLIPADESGDLRIHALLNACELRHNCETNQSQSSSLSLRYLEPVEWDSAMVAAVEAVLEAPNFTQEEVLRVISRSRSPEGRAKGMARWIKKLVETDRIHFVEAALNQSKLRPEDEAAAHSLLARRLLSNELYENASHHVVASIQCGTEKIEGWESVQRVELLTAISRAAGSKGKAFFEEAVRLVKNYPNSKPIEKTLLCSSLARTAIYHRRQKPVISADQSKLEISARFDKRAWTEEANYWFTEISQLQECPGTGYQRRARKVMILCEKAKHLYQLDWNEEEQREALKSAQIAARCEPSLQRRCELMCEVAEAYAACGDVLGANELFSDIQAELPVLPATNPHGYLWRKRGIKPHMLRGYCLTELVLGLGKVSIQSQNLTRQIHQPDGMQQAFSKWKTDRSLTTKQRARIEEIRVAILRGDIKAALNAASQISGNEAAISELRAAVFRELTSQIDWSAWALTYASDPDNSDFPNDQDLRPHQSALRGWALASASRNKWGQAWKFVRRISDPTVASNTFRDLAEFSARVGAVYDVRQRARNLMSSQDKDRVLHRIVAALVERYREERNSDERAAIKQLLMELVPPCAESFGATYLMLARLIEIDPRNWQTVAEVLRSRSLTQS